MRSLLRRAPAFAVALIFIAPHALAAQNVLRLPGKTVEVIGLEDWTIPMLQDSLRKYAEGVTLDSHACAAVLQQELGFPAAAVQVRMTITGADTTEYVAVSVVEPADSARVRKRAVGGDSVRFPRGWEEAGTLMRREPAAGFALSNNLREPPPFLADKAAQVRQAWAFVDSRRNPPGYAEAARVLESDPNFHARILAAAILREAPAEDALLYALVRAARDDNDMVSTLSASTAARMARQRREVDWAPVAEDVHALLDGSKLYALEPVMQALAASGVDGRWAAPFLAGGGHAVLARLDAQDARTSRPAHRLLVALRGEDLGTGSAAWRAWVASLGR
jgi:hypothetical protein